MPCPKILLCGHGCSNFCGQDCGCSQPKCEILELGSMSLQHGQSEHDMPVVGTDDIWDSPIRVSNQRGHVESQARGATVSVSPRRGKFASSDVRNELSGDFSAPIHKATYPSGNGSKKSYAFMAGNNDYSSRHIPDTPSRHGRASSWQNWDAAKADKEMSERRLRNEALAPKVDSSTLLFKETYRAVKIEDGIRMSDHSSSSRRLVKRAVAEASASTFPLPPARPPRTPFSPPRTATAKPKPALAKNDPSILRAGHSIVTMDDALSHLSIVDREPLIDLSNTTDTPTNSGSSINVVKNDEKSKDVLSWVLDVGEAASSVSSGRAGGLDEEEPLIDFD